MVIIEEGLSIHFGMHVKITYSYIVGMRKKLFEYCEQNAKTMQEEEQMLSEGILIIIESERKVQKRERRSIESHAKKPSMRII